MKKWRTVTSKKLLQHPRLTVYEDTVELPNGHVTDYIHFGKGNDAACIIAIDEKGRVLVQREYSYPPDEWLYQFPGGHLHEDESVEQGGLRELQEEAGLTGSVQRLGWIYPDNRRRKEKLHMLVVTELKAAPGHKDPEEEFETFWLTPEEIEALIARDEIVNYSMLAAWALYRSKWYTDKI